jgi:hypothetical protein
LAEKVPTTVHSLCPHFSFVPTTSTANCFRAPSPTRISFVPHSNFRPAVILKSGRVAKAAGCTPRSGTFAGVPVERFGMSTMTKSSPEESGDSAPPPSTAPRAIPGAWAMISIESPKSALIISLSLPARITMALSGDPAARSVFLNPSPIDSTATKTATTSAMPIVVERDAPRRCGIVPRPSK